MRASIYIKHDRIFLCRVEIHREIKPVPVLELAVGASDCSHAYLARRIILQRIFSGEQCPGNLAVSRSYLNHAWDIETAVSVYEPGAFSIELNIVPTLFRRQPCRCAEFYGAFAGDIDIDAEQLLFGRGDLGGGVEYSLAVFLHELDVGGDLRDAVNVAERVAEVEALVAVAVVSAVDEFAGKAEPMQRLGRLHPLFIVLSQNGFLEFSVGSPVHVQSHVLLGAVQNLDEDVAAVRRPCDIGQILVISEIVGLEINGGVLRQVVHADPHVFGSHAVHRIFDVHQ